MRFLSVQKSKIKIIFFLSNLAGGGAQRTIVNLLRNINRDSFSICLTLLNLNNNDPFLPLVPKDVKIINLKSRARNSIFKIRKLIKTNKPDILLSTLPQVNFAVWLGNKLAGNKAKLILRETNYREKGINTSLLYHNIYRKIYNDAHHVIGLSDGVTQHMIKSYGLNPAKVTRIYNPIDIEYIVVKSSESCELHFSKTFKMVSCGRLVKQKNYPLLVRALAILKEKGYQDFELFILGDGPQKLQLEEMICKYNLKDNIRLIGYQKNPFPYMKMADLFILSSLWEGFGHVIVESMVCGTPVLATDCPHGPREILEDGKYGWLVNNNDHYAMANKLEELILNPNKINDMANKLRNKINTFSVNEITKQYEDIFRILCRSET